MTHPDELPEKFDRLAAALRLEHVEREEEIRCAMLALVAGCTIFLLGQPGIAKSMLSRRIHAYISGGRYFDHDLDRFSVPEDLFGPRSITAMREDRWERMVEGTLVTADWCFLDEFFEASSALLKTMLRALNEREFHQGTDIIPMNLTTVFCASNEVPSDPRLMPLYDRLLLRRHLQPIRDGSSFITMLDLVREEKPDPLLVWDEVRLAQAQAATIAIPLPVREAVAQIREALAEVDIRPSDRRCYDAQRVVRAAAWLDGCTVAEAEHLRCLSDIFWSHPDQIHDVEHIVDTILEPLISQADELLRGVRALNQQIRSDVEETERQRLANELHDKAKDAARQLAELAAASSGSPRQRRKLEAVDAALRDLSHRILVELFQIDVGP